MLRFFAISIVSLASLVAKALAADPTVVLDNTSPIELGPETDKIQLFIKIVPEAIACKTARPTVDALYVGAVQKSTAGFSAQWERSDPPLEISVRFPREWFTPAGNYDLYLSVPVMNAGVQTSLRLKCQVVSAAPKLAPVGKLVIIRTRNLPFLDPAIDVQPTLTLQEVTKKSPLTITAIHPTGQVMVGDKAGDGTIDFSGNLPEIGAGTTKNVCYSLKGEFPLGTAQISARIDAKELSDQAGTIDFEVRTRWHALWILVPVLGGLVMSFFLKVVLQKRIDLDATRLDAVRLLNRVKADLLAYAKDYAFATAVNPNYLTLQSAAGGSEIPRITEARTALELVWSTAVKDFQNRQQVERAEIADLRNVTDSSQFRLPPAISAKLDVALGDVDSKVQRGAFIANDLTESKNLRSKIVVALGQDISAIAADWQNKLKQILESFQNCPTA